MAGLGVLLLAGSVHIDHHIHTNLDYQRAYNLLIEPKEQ